MIKTVMQEEVNFLLKILDKYIEHLESAEHSLIAKIFGLYTVKSKQFKQVHLILMENTVQLRDPRSDLLYFDLKGSTIAREVKLKENADGFWKKSLNYKGDLKDINFLKIQKAYGKNLVYMDDMTQLQIKKVLD